MEYREQMRLYIKNLRKSIELNNEEIKHLNKVVDFNLECIDHTKLINKGVEENLANALKEMNCE